MTAAQQSTLIVIAGPALAGRRELARQLSSRRGAARVQAPDPGYLDALDRALADSMEVVIEGEFMTRRELADVLDRAPGRAVLVEWLASAEEAERRRYAGRPQYVEERELAGYRDYMALREPYDDTLPVAKRAVVASGLPLSEQLLAVEALLPPRPVAEPAPAQASSARQQRRILVVDDDDDMRDALVDVLVELGYAVEPAASGEQALARLERAPAIDVVVSDQRMPGMSGTELMHAIRDRFPTVRTLLLTGYGDDPTCAAALDARAQTVLAKPLRVMDLERALQEALH